MDADFRRQLNVTNDEGRETKEEIIVHRPSHEVAVIIPPSFIETSKTKPKKLNLCLSVSSIEIPLRFNKTERSLFKMIFLLKVEIKKLPDIPVKDFLGFVVKEWEYFIRMKKRGRILAGGKLAGSRGAAAIIEVDTNEDLDQLVTNLPLFPFFTDIEITPLVPTDKALTDVKRIHSLMK